MSRIGGANCHLNAYTVWTVNLTKENDNEFGL